MKTLFSKHRFAFGMGIIMILIIWIVASLAIHQEIIFPTPWSTLRDLVQILIVPHTYLVLATTLFRILVAVLISFVLALIFASLSIKYPHFASFIRPQITLLKTIPVASIIIILLVLIGHEYSPLFITGFVVLPLLYEAIYQGYRSIDPNILDDVRMLSTINIPIIRHVYLPLISPFLFTGLIQSLGLGLKVMIMSEFIIQPTLSIGRELLFLKQQFEMGKVFAWTFILMILIMVIEFLISILKKQWTLKG